MTVRATTQCTLCACVSSAKCSEVAFSRLALSACPNCFCSESDNASRISASLMSKAAQIGCKAVVSSFASSLIVLSGKTPLRTSH